MDEAVRRDQHSAVLENREKLTLSGVTAVEGFDDRAVMLYTRLGELVILGRGLQIESMSIETGDVTVSGEVQALRYGDRDRSMPQGFFGRLLR